MSDPPDPSAPIVPPTPVAPPVTPPPSDNKPFAVFPDKASFDARLDRAKRSYATQELGMSLSDAKAAIESANQLRAADEERQKQEMTALERERATREEWEQKATQAQEAADLAAFDVAVFKACAGHKITDVDFARYLIVQEAEGLGEGEELDENDFLAKLLEDPAKRRQLCEDATVEPPPPTTQIDSPATTSPATSAPPGSPGGPPTPTSATQGPEVDALKMTKEQWRQRKAALGIYT